MRRHFLALTLASLAASLSAETILLYDFEGAVDNFEGRTSSVADGATHGKKALKIDAKGSVGWNQNLAVLAKNADWSEAVELLVDVTMPEGTRGAAEFVQFVPTFAGPLNNFYQTRKVELQDGLNKISIPIDGKGKIGTPFKLHLVVLTGKPMPGPIYVDNLRMRTPGKPGTLKFTVKDRSGQAVAGAIVAVEKQALVTDGSGQASAKMAADKYKVEVLADGYETATQDVVVDPGSEKAVPLELTPKPVMAPRPVKAIVHADQPGSPFDAAKIYGHNMAMWNTADPFTNPLSIKKLREVQASQIRVPGGEYGNQWNWQTGNIHKQGQEAEVDWAPEANWETWKKFLHAFGPREEAVLILNTFQRSPEDMVAWIRDARDSGIKVKYVELGNEPDLFPERYFAGRKGASTEVDSYVKVVAKFARAVRANFPDIKILGPCTAQMVHRECPGKVPWACTVYGPDGPIPFAEGNEHWMHKFLRLYSKEGDLLDGISFHSYPYWPGDPPTWDPVKAFETTKTMETFLPKWKEWMKEYYPAKAGKMDIAMTEYHIQVPENWVTADVPSAVWHANYLGEFIKYGGTMAQSWDINTMKLGEGGGHGMLDINMDPNRPYAERAKYWAFKMLARNFTGSFLPVTSSDPSVAAYAATDRGRTTVMLLNRDAKAPATVTVQVAGAGKVSQMRSLRLSGKDYVWSKVLYRAVVNKDPTLGANQKVSAAPADAGGWRTFSPTIEPMSLNMYVLEP